MKTPTLRLMVLCSVPLFGACAGDAGPKGPAVKIDVAPLTLPNVQGVEYALAVFNANPADYGDIFDVDGVVSATNASILVWQQNSVTSNQYGNDGGGDISYVGTCDASSSFNWVALDLKQISVGASGGSYSGTGPFASQSVLDDENSAFTSSPGSNDGDSDFINPSDFADPLVMSFPCNENEDTAVVFNLTVMRDAEQGFFDIAVNFEDIFCSMKIDTCYQGGSAIKLLFDDNGDRVETAVLAAACSAGTDDNDTVMWMGDLTVTCDDGDGNVTFAIDPTGGSTGNSDGEAGNDCTSTTTGGGGTHTVPGNIAHGTITFTPDFQFHYTIPAGTVVTSTTGFTYVTTGEAVFDDNTVAITVNAVAAGSGAGYNNPPAFNPIFVLGGELREVVTGTFTGGTDDQIVDNGNGTTYDLCFALYWGAEDLLCYENGQQVPCNKEYWNVAINIDQLRDQGLMNCRIQTAVTASSSTDVSPPTFVQGNLPGPGQTYGYVDFDGNVTAGDGSPTCFQGPMGSDEAAIVYGSTPDLLGGTPFPELWYNFVQGADSPNALCDTGERTFGCSAR